MRPAATEGVEKPSPIPVAFQSRFGPPAGHSLSRPVSDETPVRFAPRQAGQSPAAALSWARAGAAVPRRASARYSPINRFQGIASLLKKGPPGPGAGSLRSPLRLARGGSRVQDVTPPPAAGPTGGQTVRMPWALVLGLLVDVVIEAAAEDLLGRE